MKKFFYFICCALVFMRTMCYADVTGKFELGANYSTVTKLENIKADFQAVASEDFMDINFTGTVAKVQTHDTLNQLGTKMSVQGDIFNIVPVGYLLIGLDYRRDLLPGLSQDQTMIGAGYGIKGKDQSLLSQYNLQSGIYFRSTYDPGMERELVNRSKICLVYPLDKGLSIEESGELIVNIDNIDDEDYESINKLALVANLKDAVYLSLAWENEYKHRPDDGEIGTKNEYTLSLGYRF